MTQAALSQIENGKRPGTQTLKKICAVLKVPEPLIYIASMEKEDIPEENASAYDHLFPIILNMVSQIAG